ncbi:MAG: hypothetical protein DHS20C01_01720 [marine bacterium B5-7]|nr:MAG: hypothetical protein DHS20C01_01720 [marine bacterium B5-7]
MNRQRGSALLIALWGAMLISLVAGSFTARIKSDHLLSRHVVETTRARMAAEAGLNQILFNFLVHTTSLQYRGTLQLQDSEIRWAVVDEASKLSSNRADKETLESFLRLAGVAGQRVSTIAASIIDWRDKDHQVSPNGAEDDQYRSMGRNHGSRDAPFQQIDELLQVNGITRDDFERMVNAISIYGSNTDQSGKDSRGNPSWSRILNHDDTESEDISGNAKTPQLFTVHVLARLPTGTSTEIRATVQLRTHGDGRPFQMLHQDSDVSGRASYWASTIIREQG